MARTVGTRTDYKTLTMEFHWEGQSVQLKEVPLCMKQINKLEASGQIPELFHPKAELTEEKLPLLTHSFPIKEAG